MMKVLALVVLVLVSVAAAYDRSAAKSYADKWWNTANHDCGSSYDSCTPYSYWGGDVCGYPSHGGDCANFVSQCLLAGGHPALNGGAPCRGYPCGKEEIEAHGLGDCLHSRFNWVRTCGYKQAPPSNIQVGDVLIYHEDSCDGYTAHATIVTSTEGTVKISCHSSPRHNVEYTAVFSGSHYYYEWLHYQQ